MKPEIRHVPVVDELRTRASMYNTTLRSDAYTILLKLGEFNLVWFAFFV